MADATTINVSTEELRNTSQKIKTRNESLDQKLQSIKQQMNNLEQTWTSEASTEIRGKMNAMEGKFKEYKQVVESYAKFLIDAAEIYEQTETNAKKNASQFK